MKICSVNFSGRRAPVRTAKPEAVDMFCPSPAAPLLLRPRRSPEVPDIRAMLAQGLRHSELNLGINTAYVKMAGLFQDIYDLPRQGMPSWYAFAPFASREAGSGMRRAEAVIKLLEQNEGPNSPTELLSALFPHSRNQPQGVVEVVAGARMTRLIAGLSGTPKERFLQVARSALNMLEAGNLAIVSEIGVAGQDFLQWRGGREQPPTPVEVLAEFAEESQQAGRMYAFMEQAVLGGGDLPTDFSGPFPSSRFDRKNLLAAGFAAYEAARLESDPAVKARWVQQAGIALAYREQHDVVAQAFENTPPGEIDRMEMFRILTPFVQVPHRGGIWSYQETLGRRVLDKNWAVFDDRWGGILHFFGQVFENPGVLWPMPHPHPDHPL